MSNQIYFGQKMLIFENFMKYLILLGNTKLIKYFGYKPKYKKKFKLKLGKIL